MKQIILIFTIFLLFGCVSQENKKGDIDLVKIGCGGSSFQDPIDIYKSSQNSTLYFGDEKISKVDISSLDLLKFNDSKDFIVYLKDKNNVYFSDGISKLDGVDSKTFHIIKCLNSFGGAINCFFADKNSIYLNNHRLEGADINSFTILEDSGFSKDKNHVYFYSDIQRLIDAKTFELLSGGICPYAKDKNNAYYDNKLIPGADPESFIYVGGNGVCEDYAKDKKNVYFNRDIIKNANPKTFVISE